MGGVDVAGYEPLVNGVKELIHKYGDHQPLLGDWRGNIQAAGNQRMGQIHCKNFVKRVAERVSGRKGIFCGKPLENAQLLSELPQF